MKFGEILPVQCGIFAPLVWSKKPVDEGKVVGGQQVGIETNPWQV